MSARTRERSRELAAHLKAHMVERLTGSCPWGCGRPIPNGGVRLLEHLNHCRGPKKSRR